MLLYLKFMFIIEKTFLFIFLFILFLITGYLVQMTLLTLIFL